MTQDTAKQDRPLDYDETALDFDAAHDEDGRRNPRLAKAQRAPNQADAPGAEVLAAERDGENSFDDEGQPSGSAIDRAEAADSSLSTRDLSVLGAGSGLDEAELAEVDPVGKKESREREAKITAHARDPNAFEPAETEVRRAMQAERDATEKKR